MEEVVLLEVRANKASGSRKAKSLLVTKLHGLRKKRKKGKEGGRHGRGENSKANHKRKLWVERENGLTQT